MALKTADRVYETSTTQGTGTYNLGGTIANWRSFVSAIGNGNKTVYLAADSTNFEVGIGTVTSGSPNTLSRTTILSSSNSNAAVSWGPGTRNIYCTYAADTNLPTDENLNNVSFFGAGGGTANVQTVTLDRTPKAYSDGMMIVYRATVANTAAMTVNVNGLGAKSLKISGNDPAAGQIAIGTLVVAIYKASNNTFETINLRTAVLPADVSAGLGMLLRAKAPSTISNNTTDANNYIDISAGAFTTDGGVLVNPSAMTKRLNAVWVAGTNAGGLDTGSKAASTNYAVFVIYNPTTAAVDYLFSTSDTAPTMPSGYTDKRRIGWIRTNASSNIEAFTQDGDDFRYNTPIVISSVIGTTQAAISLPSCPKNTRALLRISSPSSTSYILLSPTTETNAAPNGTTSPLANVPGISDAKELTIKVNASSQINGRASGSITTYIAVVGWTDRRGRDD